MLSELTLTVPVFIKSTDFNRSTGIRPKTVRQAVPQEGGVNVITPRYPAGLFHHNHEVFIFRSRGKR